MIYGIVSSRDFTNYQLMEQILDLYRPQITKVISGGARGADTLARQYCEKYGIPIIEHKNNFQRNGIKGYFDRNRQIVNESNVIIAFWDGTSPGTKHTIDYARSVQKEPLIIRV